MSAYDVSLFKTLLSSDKASIQVPAYRIPNAETSAQAVEVACKAFEAI